MTRRVTLAIPCPTRALPLQSAGFVVTIFSSQQLIIIIPQRILTKRAASRRAEDLEFSDSEDVDPNRARFVGPHNSGWPRAPFLPAGPGQRNLCINAQPVHLKAILKYAVKCLTRDCAFKHGYIPVEEQTDCLLRILTSAAAKMNRPYYSERVQKDSLLQRVICDLVGPLFPRIQVLTQVVVNCARFTLPDQYQAGCHASRDTRIRTLERQGRTRMSSHEPAFQGHLYL